VSAKIDSCRIPLWSGLVVSSGRADHRPQD